MDLFRYVDAPSFKDKAFVRLGEAVLTYGTLHYTMGLVGRLLVDHGLRLADRVAVISTHDLAAISLYLSAMRLGVTPILIDPQCAHEEADTLLQAGRVAAVFADGRFVRTSDDGAERRAGIPVFRIDPGEADRSSGPWSLSRTLPFLSHFEPLRTLPATVPGHTGAFILFTSGTTSRPKGVQASLNAVASHMASMRRQYGYTPDSVILNGLPLHHSDGINHGAVNAMAAGGTLIRTGEFSVQRLPEMLALIRRYDATHMITVPTVLALISRLGSEFNDAFCSPSFRFISSTAGPLDESLWRSFEARFGTLIVNSYGLTETVCEGLYCGPTPETRRVGTIGKPVDVEARVVGPHGRDAADGEMGELLLRGSCVMTGYFDAPEETAEVLRDGWLHTGDLAIRDADGFYSITGRKKNVIISGGINIYPEDVDRSIARMPGVREVATVGMPDSIWGERAVSCVCTDPGATVDETQVIEYCRTHMAREKVPSRVFNVAALPRGMSGKVSLPELRRMVADLLSGEDVTGVVYPPVNVTERVLALAAASFNSPLGQLGLDSELEAIDGWSSLVHMDFLLALESAFGMQLDPGNMLSIVTLGDAVALVAGASAGKGDKSHTAAAGPQKTA